MTQNISNNPLGTENTGTLLARFAIPSIIAMLVSSLYNIVDQFFIGQSVGQNGNAATNISFPFSTSCIAVALLFGIGGSSAFNISLGKGQTWKKEKEKAPYYLGNSISMMLSLGVILCLLTLIFLEPLLLFFGSPKEVLPFAKSYAGVTALGFPFLIMSMGGGHLLRADGRPKYTMICNITGAVINTILDALFVFVFQWGMAGAAAATIIGQFISGSMALFLLLHCQSVTLEKKHFRIQKKYVARIASLGTAPCSNQIAMMIVQIVMNNSLKYYGSLSHYGEAIPIACTGIITKVNMIFMSFIIGISQGLQPIVSFNFGAGNGKRVKQAWSLAAAIGFTIALFFFGMFQIFPHQIISMFGKGTKDYYTFAENYFHIFLFFTFLNFLQPITSNFFTAIGKPKGGVFLSMTRQILFLLPLIAILPLFFGIDGIMYAGPVADLMAAVCAILMIRHEFRTISSSSAAEESAHKSRQS